MASASARAHFDVRAKDLVTKYLNGFSSRSASLTNVATHLSIVTPEGAARVASGDKFGWMHAVRHALLRTGFRVEKIDDVATVQFGDARPTPVASSGIDIAEIEHAAFMVVKDRPVVLAGLSENLRYAMPSAGPYNAAEWLYLVHQAVQGSARMGVWIANGEITVRPKTPIAGDGKSA